MKEFKKKFLSLLILFQILSFFLLWGYDYFASKRSGVIFSMVFEYSLLSAFIAFIRSYVPISLSSLITAASMSYEPRTDGKRYLLGIFAGVSLVYAILSVLLLPSLAEEKKRIGYLSDFEKNYIREIEDIAGNKNIIKMSQKEMYDLLCSVRGEKRDHLLKLAEVCAAADPKNKVMGRICDFVKMGADEKKEASAEDHEDIGEIDKSLLYDIKKNASEMISYKRYYDAYYYLTEKKYGFPEDIWIKEKLSFLRKVLSEECFFYEDGRYFALYPGYEDIFFMNGYSDDKKEAVKIDKAVLTDEGIFLFGIEVLDYSGDGTVEYRIKAPMGKIMNDAIDMRCRSMEKDLIYLPEVFGSGFPSDYLLKLNCTDIKYYSAQNGSFQPMPLKFLISDFDLAAASGIGLRVCLDIAEKFSGMINLFFMLVVLFLAAEKLMAVSRKINNYEILLFPLFFAACCCFNEILIFFRTGVHRFILCSLSSVPALISIAVLELLPAALAAVLFCRSDMKRSV